MDIGKYTSVVNNVKNLNTDLGNITSKLASGKSFYKGSENVEKFSLQLLTEQKSHMLKIIKTDMDTAKTVLTEGDNAMTHLEDLMNSIKTELLKLSSTGEYNKQDRNIISENLTVMKKEIIAITNTKVKGDYIFSGTFTDRKPIDAEQYTINPLTGRKDYEYKGTEVKKEIYVDDNLKTPYGITAKEIIGDSNVISVLDNMINLVSNPTDTINNQLKADSSNISNDFVNTINNDIEVQYKNLPTITKSDLDKLTEYKDLVEAHNKDKTASITEVENAYTALTAEPIFATNIDGITKMLDTAKYIDNIDTYNKTHNVEDFDVAFNNLNSLKDDTLYAVSGFSSKEKEDFSYMLEMANMNYHAGEFIKDNTNTELAQNIKDNKQYLLNELDSNFDFNTIKDLNSSIVSKQLDNIKSTILANPALTVGDKDEYKTYFNNIDTYFQDRTAANLNAVNLQKTTIDGLGLGAVQDKITQHIQDLVDYTDNIPTKWTTNVDNDAVNKKVENLYNLAKNPFSTDLSEWETARQKISSLHSSIGNQYLYVQEVDKRVESQKLSLETFYQDNISTDVAEISMQLQNKKNSLKALYSVISQIQNLSLANYM